LGEGSAWQWYLEKCLDTHIFVLQDVNQPTAITTDRVLLMGEKAARMYHHCDADIFKLRGQLLSVGGKPATATLDLQSSWDFKVDKTEKEDRTGKDSAATRKSNWLFWIEADTKKILGTISQPTSCKAIYYPNIDKVISKLQSTNNQTIYLDIESDIHSDTLDCIGLMIDQPPVVVVPIYRHTGKLAYDKLKVMQFLAAFSSALLRNKAVIHNANFDLLYLATRYRLPFGPRIHDTMIAHKRALPEAEKSLGHAISYWTWQPYHKDEAAANKSKAGEEKLWAYNAKDVYSMSLVYHAQLQAAAADINLSNSINQANASIYPYLLATLQGVAIDIHGLNAYKQLADRRIKQVTRIIKLLTGDDKFNPGSSTQLTKYFHTKLHYKVQETTDTGAPSLGGKALYELALSYPNPLIPCILHYRELVKERSMTEFGNHIFPWEEL
jgi:hypothetical protein